MKKKWPIVVTANILSALVCPLAIHASNPTTASTNIEGKESLNMTSPKDSGLLNKDNSSQSVSDFLTTEDEQTKLIESNVLDDRTLETSTSEEIIKVTENSNSTGNSASEKLSNIQNLDQKNNKITSQVTGIWGSVKWLFDKDTGVLTFYENGEKGLGDFQNSPWNNSENKIDALQIKEMIFTKPVKTPEHSNLLFSSNNAKLNNLTKISGIENLDTSNTTNMKNMFDGMTSLSSLDLSHFVTDKVTNMNCMFFNMSSLQNLDVSNFKTDNVTNMSQMFDGVSSIKKLDLSSFSTNKVTTMFAMFYKTSSLKELNVSSFDTSSVTDMESMFRNVSSLETLDISSFNTKEVTTMNAMFEDDQSMKQLIFDKELFDTSNVTNMYCMFNNMPNLEKLDVSNFHTSKVVTMTKMFNNNKKITELDVSKFDTSRVNNTPQMFSGMSSLQVVDVSNFDTGNVTNMSQMFSGMSNVQAIDVSHFDTQKVTDMARMFTGISKVTTLDVSHFNTSKVTNMQNMFSYMTNITSLNLGSFDFTNVKMDKQGRSSKLQMFSHTPLKEITLPVTFSDPENKTDLRDVPNNDIYNGNWVNIDNKNVNLGQTIDFLKHFNGEKDAGTYIWGRHVEFRLVKVPDLYDFGQNNAIRDRSQIFKPKENTQKDVEIQDNRKQKTPWTLTVKASPLVSNSQDSLQKARYQFGISTSKVNEKTVNLIPNLNKQVELQTNNASQELYTMADTSNANETYRTVINNMSLILDKNTGKPNEQYSGTITWSLDMTPK